MRELTTVAVLAKLEPHNYRYEDLTDQVLSPAILAFLPEMYHTQQKAEIGIGLVDDSSIVVRSWSSHKTGFMQSYRGAKLLSYCKSFHDDTLCACYYAMSKDISQTTQHYLHALEENGLKNCRELRKSILDTEPDSDLVVRIITSAEKYHINLSTKLVVA